MSCRLVLQQNTYVDSDTGAGTAASKAAETSKSVSTMSIPDAGAGVCAGAGARSTTLPPAIDDERLDGVASEAGARRAGGTSCACPCGGLGPGRAGVDSPLLLRPVGCVQVGAFVHVVFGCILVALW
jgi:hypothetical protein